MRKRRYVSDAERELLLTASPTSLADPKGDAERLRRARITLVCTYLAGTLSLEETRAIADELGIRL